MTKFILYRPSFLRGLSLRMHLMRRFADVLGHPFFWLCSDTVLCHFSVLVTSFLNNFTQVLVTNSLYILDLSNLVFKSFCLQVSLLGSGPENSLFDFSSQNFSWFSVLGLDTRAASNYTILRASANSLHGYSLPKSLLSSGENSGITFMQVQR